MKWHRSKIKDLRDIFSKEITIAHVSSPLISKAKECDAVPTREFMEAEGFDDIGVLDEGVVRGYVNQSELKDGKCGDRMQNFKIGELATDSTPLLDALSILRDRQRLFLLRGDRVNGIATLADLHKIPVALLLFGLISIFETCMSDVIRPKYSDDDLVRIFGAGHLKHAMSIQKRLENGNEFLRLTDCLSFRDKLKLFFKIPGTRELPGIEDNIDLFRSRSICRLRDDIAHGQYVAWDKSRLPEIIQVAERLRERIIPCCEDYADQQEKLSEQDG